MRTASLLFLALTLTASGQLVTSQRAPGSYFSEGGPPPPFNIVGTRPPTLLLPRDPLRLLGDNVWQLRGEDETNGWVEFHGRVLEVQPGGVRLRGSFTGFSGDMDFYVAHFPYVVAEGDVVGRDINSKTFFCARVVGVFTYHSIGAGSRTIKKLDYGQIYVPPPLTPEEIAALKAASDKKKKAADASTVKWLLDQADAGDANAQLRMGQRYLKGDGVEKDEANAREYLTKAAAQGNEDAREILKRLPLQQTTAKD